MNKRDLGVDQKTGKHSTILTREESAFLGVIWTDHVGHSNRISGRQLAMKLAEALGEWPKKHEHFEQFVQRWMRTVRQLQNHLLTEHNNIPIFSQAGKAGGYWIGEGDDEGACFYDTFRRRGLTGLLKGARGKQAVVVEMVQQLSLEFDDLQDETGEAIVTMRGRSTAVEVVDALVKKMMEDPERFSGDLQKLRVKLGAVLMPKEKARQIMETATKLKDLVGELGGAG